MSLMGIPEAFRQLMIRRFSKSWSVNTRAPPWLRPTKGSRPSLS